MFNLEQSIAEWRQQMLAAGIKTPVPLEELESHLREEIEHLVQHGVIEQQAFELAVFRLGPAPTLKAEFKKTNGLLGWLGNDTQTRTHRCLAALWLPVCCWVFFFITQQILNLVVGDLVCRESRGINAELLFLLLLEAIYLRGIFASCALFQSNTGGLRSIRFTAIIGLIIIVSMQAMLYKNTVITPRTVALFVFHIISIWLLRNQKPSDKKLTAD